MCFRWGGFGKSLIIISIVWKDNMNEAVVLMMASKWCCSCCNVSIFTLELETPSNATDSLPLCFAVPPSMPRCQIHGSPHVGGNISMSCKSSLGKPGPRYRWQRTSPTHQFFFEPAQGMECICACC